MSVVRKADQAVGPHGNGASKKAKTAPAAIQDDALSFVKKMGLSARIIEPDNFEDENHFYPRVLNATLHPMVKSFLSLGNARIAQRYCHMRPEVDEEALLAVLKSDPKHFKWAGADLFNVTTSKGDRHMVVIETNSCPSGQKSMPRFNHDDDSETGYHKLMSSTFKDMIEENKETMPEGALAVIYDKNEMEATGYASAMAEVFQEKVYLAEFYHYDLDPPVQFNKQGVLQVRTSDNEWVPIRAAFRYVTQQPWGRIPVDISTVMLNRTVCCLAGGRNKMAADKAYEFFNREIEGTGLQICTPETIRDTPKPMIPMWVDSMGGHAVVKVPYANAGQGVYTITNKRELDEFMENDEGRYNKYIVQSLVGNASWSSKTSRGQLFHTGTIPNKKKQSFVSDLRMMISATPKGFQPLAIYARKAAKPLKAKLGPDDDSWAMLGTNLSKKVDSVHFTTETGRLVLMDTKDFNALGLGLDDLIDGYVQTVLATTAIDKMAGRLLRADGTFDMELYGALNQDKALISEIMTAGSAE